MMSYFLRGKHLWMTAYALTLAATCLVTAASAQQYRVDEPDEKAKRFGASAAIWVRDRADYTTGKAQFDEYFQKYFFPAMTRTSPGGLAEVGKLRFDLFKKFLWGTSNEQLQKDLTDMALKWGKTVVSQQAPPYHPTVRYNATLVIGMLDEQYAIDSGTNLRPPKPLAGATKVLTTIVNMGSEGDRFPPPVVLGALIGLERHAKYHAALPPESVKDISATLLKFVNRDPEKPIQGMDPDAYAWLRLRAAIALVNLGTLGEKNAVHDALIKLIGSSKSIDDRCSAAALLGNLKYEGAKIDAPAATGALFKLASDLSAEELKRAMDFEKIQIAGGGFSESRISRLSPDDPGAADDGFPRRHVVARLVDLRTGLRAIKPAVPADSQKEIDAILAAIKPVVDAASNKDTGSLAVANAIRTMNEQIALTAGPADSATDDEDEFSASAPVPAAGAPATAVAAPGDAPAAAPAAAPPAASETPPAEAPAAATN